MRKRYVVKLTPEEREQGSKLYDKAAAERTGFTRCTAEQIRERCVSEGLTAALERKPRRDRGKRKLDGEAKARLLSIACSHPPTGRARWTLQRLANQLVSLNIVDTFSHESVRQVLKKRHQTLAKTDVVYSA